MFKEKKNVTPPKKNIWQYSLDILNRRMKTEFELSQKLYDKGYQENEIKQTIIRLKEHGFLNDTTYAKLYADIKSKKGNYRIKQELHKKGVHKDTIIEAIENIEDELKRALPVGEKKWNTLNKKEDIEISEKKDKLVRFLNSRGFAYTVCIKITEVVSKSKIDNYDTE